MPCRTSRGFTLVELMISLGIAILLIYGVNLVFRAVADTVRSGNALAVATRKMRSVESALTIDFEGTYEERDPISATGATGKQQQLERRWSGLTPIITDMKTTLPYNQQPRQPAITIFCKRQAAFFNKADLEANSDQAGANATNPAMFDETESGNVVDFNDAAQLARVGGRIHRVDTIGFFTGGSFAAHAVPFGNGLIGGEASQAWVWYGHLLQHDTADNLTIKTIDELAPIDTAGKVAKTPPGPPNLARFYQPGQISAGTVLAPGSHRNSFAGDWVLGRMAMTLLPRTNSTSSNPGVPILGVAPGRPVYQIYTETAANQTGIGFDASEKKASADSSTYVSTPADRREWIPKDTDVPATSAMPFTSGLRDAVGIYTGQASTPSFTYLPTGAIGTLTDSPTSTVAYSSSLFTGLVYRYWNFQTSTEKTTWWQHSMLQPDSAPTVIWPLRFNTVTAFSKPVIDDSKVGLGKLNPQDKASLQSTYIAKGCTQFIVEFAGDFVKQNAAGEVTSGTTITPDGVLDFDMVGGLRRTQWYGMPRDVTGDGVAEVDSKGFAGGDVVPIFKKMGSTTDPKTAASANSIEKDYVPGDHYIVAFGPNDMYPNGKFQKDSIRPWLIRLTVVLSDSNGSLPSGLSREFVFKVR